MTQLTDADEARLRVVHDADDRRLLATRVEVADGEFARARGLMFRLSVPDRFALVFPFDSVDSRPMNMLAVPFALDVVWTVDDEVTQVKRLSAWIGRGAARADRVFELPAGAAEEVDVGDELRAVQPRAEVVG